MKLKPLTLASTLALASTITSLASAATETELDNAFHPYKKGFPAFPGLNPGLVINKANVDQFKDALDPANYQLVKDGWYEVTAVPTIDFPNAKGYVEATKAHSGSVKLGGKNGEISGYVAGRPFPEEPDLKDPRAGEKLAWNFKYGVNYGDSGSIYPFYWRYRNAATGQIERTIKFEFHFLNFMHRVEQPPIPEITPNPAKIYRGTYAKAYEPQDLKNTQLLIQRFEDDTKLDDAYLYLGFQRRVRRLATGQTTDAFLGSDMMIEDFEGYNGRISDISDYKGTVNMLVPFFNHNEQKLTQYKDLTAISSWICTAKTVHAECHLSITQVLHPEATGVVPMRSASGCSTWSQTVYAGRALIYDRKGQV
jgi:hypothetical protein